MTSQQIPQLLDPFKYIGARLELAGNVALERLTRLDGLLANHEGSVRVLIRFDRDEQKLAIISGELEAKVNLVCQRCTANDAVSISSEFQFALLRDEEGIEHLPAVYDPLILDKPELNVYELIEEELILALPIVHYHNDGQEGACSESIPSVFGEVDAELEEKQNPFSVLEKLKS